ncbi:ATP-binding cassette domain-containing protein [Mucilaginibacter sp. BT774]|uniref:ATP-binding cassette domain-containing protein n=1 Tax=Mucilaginibacter sp. BT774 TaxID=3062276 RepID=UPI002675DB7A|nr:ATP-binding cassette domain-containing protein [Mucilaginibacter sp. BT774]MDO3625225.1 ATP-binding cassette domain-containing protein [Mucilaginibacter sp. BT774]
MKNLLEVDSVVISFDEKNILTDCFLRCETSDIIGILGRNGCGKSSLFKVIFGTLFTHYKFIRINGKVYHQPYKNGNLIAYMPQHGFLPTNISVQDIINIYVASLAAREKIKDDLRLKNHLKKRVSELSGGELRYLEILLLVNLDVKFILLDEPFSRVEPLYKQVIVELIKEFRSSKGFIITDHDYQNIIAASDRIILINNGVCRPINDLNDLELFNYVPQGTFY